MKKQMKKFLVLSYNGIALCYVRVARFLRLSNMQKKNLDKKNEKENFEAEGFLIQNDTREVLKLTDRVTVLYHNNKMERRLIGISSLDIKNAIEEYIEKKYSGLGINFMN